MPRALTDDSKKKVLKSALREDVWDNHLKLCMEEDQHNFFFVDTGNGGPSWNAKNLSEDFKRLFSKEHRPKYQRLLKVAKGEAESLPTLLKLHVCLKAYCKHASAKYVKELKKDGWENGLPENSVVPCLYILNRQRTTSFGRDDNGHANLPNTKVFDHMMADIEYGELGRYLSEVCGSPDGLEAEDRMRRHCIDGTKERELRVSSKIACGVVNFLNSKNPPKKLDIRHLFVWSPIRGEGKGRKTNVLTIENGNVLPTVEEAVPYPTF